MNITQEETGNLTKVLKLSLSPEDYKKQYAEALEKVRKEVSMPGFRPGKVPKGLIEKKYGKSILAEEVNKIINESLYKYINDNKLKILGQPIPKENSGKEGDWDNPGEFNFEYEIGLMPELDIDLSKFKLDYNKIKIDDELIDKEIENLAKRYGTISEPEVAEEGDFLIGTLVELDDNGEIKSGGIMKETSIRTEEIKDNAIKKKLAGVKPGDKVVIDVRKVWTNEAQLSNILELTEDELKNINNNFEFQVKEIKRLKPAKINQELFDKAFGKGEITNEKELREKVKEIMKESFQRDEDYVFKNAAVETLLDKINVELPDDFMKKWILLSSERPVTAEEVEAEYDKYAKGMKWQLIENDIINKNDIKVTNEEVLEFQKRALNEQYEQYGFPLDDEMLTKLAIDSIQTREDFENVSNRLYNDKITEVLREKMKVKEKEVSLDKFVELATQKK